jgi:hypothetical protein
MRPIEWRQQQREKIMRDDTVSLIKYLPQGDLEALCRDINDGRREIPARQCQSAAIAIQARADILGLVGAPVVDAAIGKLCGASRMIPDADPLADREAGMASYDKPRSFG